LTSLAAGWREWPLELSPSAVEEDDGDGEIEALLPRVE
jgi:hypothetical protein